MATRNKTLVFKKYRDALKNVRKSPLVTSSSSSSGPVIELSSTPFLRPSGYEPVHTDESFASRGDAITVGLPPSWVDISEEVTNNMQQARKKLAMLVKLHAKALMPNFGDSMADHHAIEELSHDITSLLKRSEQMLQRLSVHNPSEDAAVQKNVQRYLATDLQSLSMEFRKQQKSYLQRFHQLQDGSDEFGLGIDSNAQKPVQEDDLESGFNKQQLSRIKKNEIFTAEREKEVAQVLESVKELQQIMQDLSYLVIDQGTIVDRIDYNIQNVAATVDQGVKQLQKAERTQKEGGMVMCATVLIFMCLFMLVLLIIKYIFFG